MNFNLNSEIENILNHLVNIGAKPYLVGGCVRDAIMAIQPKDIDVEVFGISKKKLISELKKFGSVDEYGKQFGIIVCHGVEFAIPRTETKTGEKHTDFKVKLQPYISVKKASLRRDFTINSIYYSWAKQEIVDPNNGVSHIKRKMLTHTSDQFSEDVLRSLRAIRFSTKFGFAIWYQTASLIDELVLKIDTLPTERIWGEFEKILLYPNTDYFKLFFHLKDLGFTKYLNELGDLINCPQNPVHHPEGDVYIHTRFVTNACRQILLDKKIWDKDTILILMLAAICHDLGKPSTTKNENGKITAHGHDVAGVEPTLSFLKKIGCPKVYWDKICALVEMHMVHINYTNIDVTPKIARKFKNKLAKAGITFEMLEILVLSDMSGRPPLVGKLPIGWTKLKTIYDIIDNEPIMLNGKIKPIVNGDYLISRYAYKEGKELGQKLSELYELQLDGKINSLDDAIQYI